MSSRRWLLMTNRVSTSLEMRATPSRALSICLGISNLKGMVTMPTVRMPNFMASRAMMGAAPVPVPPPMPAVMKSMLVSVPRALTISSTCCSASSSPFSGRPPAPKPGPSCTWCAMGESSSALESVLHTMKCTPSMPSRYILATALPPPPPTPMTLMLAASAAGAGGISISSDEGLICSDIEKDGFQPGD